MQSVCRTTLPPWDPLDKVLDVERGTRLAGTLGSVTIELQIEGERRSVEFQVVKSDFPVPNEGILGKPFIIGQRTIINCQSKELILPPLSSSSKITIQPRTEILVAIPAPNKTEDSNILISSHTLQMPSSVEIVLSQ